MSDEANLNVLSASFARQQIKVFPRDLQRSRPITLQAWQQRPWHEKVLEHTRLGSAASFECRWRGDPIAMASAPPLLLRSHRRRAAEPGIEDGLRGIRRCRLRLPFGLPGGMASH
jgi:hypothetical protein